MIITVVDLGREITESEMAAKIAYIETQVRANITNGLVAQVPNSNSGVRVWSNLESANDFINWSNRTYNPPPVVAFVKTV